MTCIRVVRQIMMGALSLVDKATLPTSLFELVVIAAIAIGGAALLDRETQRFNRPNAEVDGFAAIERYRREDRFNDAKLVIPCLVALLAIVAGAAYHLFLR